METIAANVGYENVEHFNRLFKKAYDMTRYSIENRARNNRSLFSKLNLGILEEPFLYHFGYRNGFLSVDYRVNKV